jgi:hypothetical protein
MEGASLTGDSSKIVMIARWSIEARFGYKQLVMQRWLQEIGFKSAGPKQTPGC